MEKETFSLENYELFKKNLIIYCKHLQQNYLEKLFYSSRLCLTSLRIFYGNVFWIYLNESPF